MNEHGSIRFFVQGDPKGQPRPRAFARKIGATWQARVYDGATAEGWKSLIAVAAKPFIPSQPLTGAIRVDATWYFPRPKSHFRTGKFEGILRPDVPHEHTGKPDRDNLDKCLLDALTQLAFWHDDAQVYGGLLLKYYAGQGQPPGCKVLIQHGEQVDPKQVSLPLAMERQKKEGQG